MSKSLHEESSDPVPKLFPSGKNCTELMSDSCPLNSHAPHDEFARMSHRMHFASQEPETNRFLSTGLSEMLITSLECAPK